MSHVSRMPVYHRVSLNSPVVAAALAVGAAVMVPLLLALLHALSPEFDPSWRVVSEYAMGQYAWVLSLMFVCWALSSWLLAIGLWPHLCGVWGRVGLGLLVLSGVGEAMASMFPIYHPLHTAAGLIGVLGLPSAATIIGVRLGRTQQWSRARAVLRCMGALTWLSLGLLVICLALLMAGYGRPGNLWRLPAMSVGWANRLLIAVYCAWIASVAFLALRTRLRCTLCRAEITVPRAGA